MRLEALVADMAGTTVRDDGLVMGAFAASLTSLGIGPDTPEGERCADFVIATMGQSKIEVFTELFGPERAIEANERFEVAYERLVGEVGVSPIPGIESLFDHLEGLGVAVGLTTGFSPRTRDVLLDALGWSSRIVVALSPVDVGAGRPSPAMNLEAIRRLGVSSLELVAVAGDTTSDMRAGAAAGVGHVIGVLSGTGAEGELLGAGASMVLDSLADLRAVLT